MLTMMMLREMDETGSTGGWRPPGAVAPLLARGDAVMYDQRTVHRGTANASGETRPVLYLLFKRPWYHENLNFGDEPLFSIEGGGGGRARGKAGKKKKKQQQRHR